LASYPLLCKTRKTERKQASNPDLPDLLRSQPLGRCRELRGLLRLFALRPAGRRPRLQASRCGLGHWHSLPLREIKLSLSVSDRAT
jgi:hypothetical protein